MKRSIDPSRVRWITTALWRRLSAPTYSSPKRSRHQEVELEGPALPLAAQRIGNQDIHLRTVEGPTALVDLVVEPAVAQHAGQPVGGRVVHRRVADRLLGPRG